MDKQAYNILIVDDNPKNIQVIGNILRENGYLAGFATDGNQALSILQTSSNYDLVLLDVEMPNMNGFDTCLAIRQIEGLKDIPVIFLTAFTDMDNKVRGFEVGAQDYITKPFNAKELLARVNTQIQLRTKTEELRKVNQNLELLVSERTSDLEMALDRLSQLDSMKTGFLIMISQEIRTPLNGIVGTVNLIKNQEHSSTIKNLVETLNMSVSELEVFTHNALLSTQLTANLYKAKIEDINLKELIQFILIELVEDIQQKNMEVDLANFAPEFTTKGDRDLMFQALRSIISNAIIQSPQNGVIDIAAKRQGMRIVVSVTDFSAGFSLELLDGIASPFSVQNERISYKHVLSFYLVTQIMEFHHGKALFFNKEHAGGCVEISLFA